jgi:hypothetical protein
MIAEAFYPNATIGASTSEDKRADILATCDLTVSSIESLERAQQEVCPSPSLRGPR